MKVVHHDVRVVDIHEVPHIIIKQTSLVHIKCWPMLAVEKKLISIFDVVGHKMILIDQAEGKDVSYSLGFIPDRILYPWRSPIFFVCVTTALQ